MVSFNLGRVPNFTFRHNLSPNGDDSIDMILLAGTQGNRIMATESFRSFAPGRDFAETNAKSIQSGPAVECRPPLGYTIIVNELNDPLTLSTAPESILISDRPN